MVAVRTRSRPEAAPLHATERNPNRDTTGGRVANVSAKMGEPFIPWQRLVADIAGEIDPATGYPWYKEILLVGLRQIGKTSFIRAKFTDTCLFTPRATARYTAQNRTMALQRLETDMWHPIAASPLAAFLDRNVGRRTKKPGLSGKGGQEHIQFVNDSAWWIDSVKATSGHGPTLDLGGIDEAFAHGDARIEQAMRPAMNNVPHAQLLVASAAGDSSSVYLRNKLEVARARLELEQTKPLHQRRSRTALIEYAAPEGADREDPDTWWGCHPALGYLTDQATFEAALEAFASDPEEFDRAYLGWWPSAKAPDPVIPKLAWNELALGEDAVDWTGQPVWSVDVAPDRDWSAIGLAARHPSKRAYLEVVDHEPGTHWVVARMVQLRSLFGGDVVAIDGTGPAGALVTDLEAEGFLVQRLNGRDKADACGELYDDALSGRIAHPGDPVLNGALFSAIKRRTADTWTFWRGKSLADITPLYAVTLARHVLAQMIGDDYDVDDSTYGLDPDPDDDL
ncbi:hypothetical protein [Cellulomonas sp. HZM]|uniref:hypothetical protein n=1 Tax=Cellulomonas sp. HZM TaxID=1454010 RepID=UPI000492ED6A|nr:hypothetical protein [Cellulomonas sp. HZM]